LGNYRSENSAYNNAGVKFGFQHRHSVLRIV
jgi:hypothetical protein